MGKKKVKTGKTKFSFEIEEGLMKIMIKSARQKKFRELNNAEKFLKNFTMGTEYREKEALLFSKGDKLFTKDVNVIKFLCENHYWQRPFKKDFLQKTLKLMLVSGKTRFKDEFVEKTLNSYQPIFVEHKGEFYIKDIEIFQGSNFFCFKGNDSQLFELGEKERKFIESFYKNFKKFPTSSFFFLEKNSKKLKKWIKKEKVKYATELPETGKLEALFDKVNEKRIFISFGVKTSFMEKNGKYYYQHFNSQLFKEVLAQIKNITYYDTERKRITFDSDFELCLAFFNILNVHKEAIDFYMDTELIEKIKGKGKIKFSMFRNNELNIPGFSMENIFLDDEDKLELLDRMRKGQLEESNGKKYVKLSGDRIIEIENSVSEILQIEDELSNYDTIELGKKMTKPELARFAVSDIKELPEEVLREREIINSFKEVEPEKPEHIKATLYPYQEKGYAWISKLYSEGYGGIIGDDMGLGKTLQVISFINKVLKENPESKFLIVAPTTLVNNWYEEFGKFTDIEPHFIYDMNPKKLEKFLETYKGGPLITSYEKGANNAELLKKIKFDAMFIDEAQKIKNPSSSTRRKLKQIKSRTKFAMTGTPIENSIMDLWSIFDFIFEGYLYSNRKFRKDYENIFIDIDKNNVSYTEEEKNEIDELVMEAEIKQRSLIRRIKPFILRRRKDEELSHILKEKKITEYKIELTEQEKELYIDTATEYQKELLETSKNIGKEGISSTEEEIEEIEEENAVKKDTGGMKIFKIIQKLKGITSLPGRMLNDGQYIEPTKLKEFRKLLLERISIGDRVLVFSSFLEVLGNTEEFLKKQNIKYFRIDGSIPASVRQEITTEFNNNEEYKVVLISLKAGAAGLNLVGANIVIHYDLWWNPSIENQANDRAYRIGQDKNVEIVKLVCMGTIEERILALQKKKQDLFDIIIEGAKGSPAGRTTRQELEELIM